MKSSTLKLIEPQPDKKNLEPTLEKAREYIYSIDFSMIINKLVKRHKWLRIEAEETCQQYRNYLWLLKLHGVDRPLPPSEEIDEFWHNHILSTNQYLMDCSKIFNEYLHHYPYYGTDGKTTPADLNSAFSETQQLYQEEFGTPIEATRYRFRPLVRLFLR